MNFLHIKKNSLYFVATSRYNVSPSFVLELLNRLTRLIKDYIGTISEENIRLNFSIVYELMDEVLVRFLNKKGLWILSNNINYLTY
jgi:AP-4 complex subunit mu-1